jgi:hypothetical protein
LEYYLLIPSDALYTPFGWQFSNPLHYYFHSTLRSICGAHLPISVSKPLINTVISRFSNHPTKHADKYPPEHRETGSCAHATANLRQASSREQGPP